VRAAGFAAPAAGKTGTTNDATDTWFVGYTPETVAAVWIGFDEPKPIMAAATGGRLAAPVWGRMMRRATAGRPTPDRWSPPANVVQAWVDGPTGVPLAAECRADYDDAYRELFLRGTMPEAGCPDHGGFFDRLLRWLPLGDDEERRQYEEWPDDLSGHSDSAPPPEYEEAERWHRRQRERQRRAEEWAERMEEMREQWEERRRQAEERRHEEEERRREAEARRREDRRRRRGRDH
jgi:membrane peptidoglycan carboxypeptidase